MMKREQLLPVMPSGGPAMFDVRDLGRDGDSASRTAQLAEQVFDEGMQTLGALTIERPTGEWGPEPQSGDAPTVVISSLGTAVEQTAFDLKGAISIADEENDALIVTLSVDYGTLHLEEGTSGALITDNDTGTVTVTGTALQIHALLNLDATSVVTYTADTDSPPATATLTVTVDDGTSSASDDQTIAITPVNDAAALDLDFFSGGNDATATFTEGTSGTYLALAATFSDDNDDWDGATLTIAIDSATADDQLTIDDYGTGPGEISIDGSNVLYEGDIVGTWSGGANSDPLIVTFNEDACGCAIQMLTASIIYSNAASPLTPSTRDVTFTFVDGGGTALGGDDTATARSN